MTRSGLIAGIALAALCALPASAQLGLGGGGSLQIPGGAIGGQGSASVGVDTRGAIDTARDTAGQTKATARATADAAKQKAAQTAATARAAAPEVQATGGASAATGAAVNPDGASASASASGDASVGVKPH